MFVLSAKSVCEQLGACFSEAASPGLEETGCSYTSEPRKGGTASCHYPAIQLCSLSSEDITAMGKLKWFLQLFAKQDPFQELVQPKPKYDESEVESLKSQPVQ